MKRIVVLIFIYLSLCSCQSNIDKANKIIDSYMFKHLHDYKSYEVVETTVDTLFNSPFANPECINLAAIANKHLNSSIDYERNADSDKESLNIWSSGGWTSYSRSEYWKAYKKWLTNIKNGTMEQIEYLETVKMILKKSATLNGTQQVGWLVNHTFRSNTLGGNSSLGTYTFFIDNEFKNIIDSFDNDDEEIKNALSTLTDILSLYSSVELVDSLITSNRGLITTTEEYLGKI